MRRDPRAFLWDVRDCADAVAEFTRGRTYRDCQANRVMRAAVERQFEIIGEALGQLAKIAPDTAVQIPELRRIVAFMNLLIHGCAVVDDKIVWQTINDDLPSLRDHADRILGQLQGGMGHV